MHRRYVDDQVLDRLHRFAVDFAINYARLADRQLKAFAAHILDKDRQVQEAAARDEEFVPFRLARDHAQGDVRFQLFHEAIAQLTARDVGSFLAAEGGIVDAKQHVERRFVDLGGRQGHGIVDVRDRVADVDLVQPDDGADVAGQNLVGLGAAEAVEDVKLFHHAVDTLAVVLHYRDALV